jgi:pyruvate dehydrogenase E1 component alpha subunit
MADETTDLIDLYYKMLLARRLEEKAGQLYTQGKIGGFCHLYIGQEAVAVGAISALRPDDYVIASYREHVHCMMCGTDIKKILAELTGRRTGVSQGKGGSMHLYDRERNFLGGHGIVGGHLPLAAGVGYAIKYRGGDQVILAFLGDGAVNIGAFHETLNIIELWDLPVVFVVENNRYGMGTPVSKASALVDIFQRACGYGLYGKFVDGMDVLSVRDVTEKAVSLARLKGRATLIEAKTYRYRGHSMSDPAKYRTKEELQEFKERDPVLRFKAHLLEEEILDPEEDQKLIARVSGEVEQAARFALESEEPPLEDLHRDVYAD